MVDRPSTLLATAGLLGTAGLLSTIGARWWRRRQASQRDVERWAVVTVLHPRTEVSASGPLEQLRGRGELEVTLRDAPGDRGTEVAARWRADRRSGRSRDELRTELRELKQTLETGEGLRVIPRPEGSRPPTPGGVVIDLADRRAQGKGVL